MTYERFSSAIKLLPFQPFVVHMADGRAIPVVHPEQVAMHPQSRTVVVDQPNESMHIIDLLLVTGLEFGNAAEKQAG